MRLLENYYVPLITAAWMIGIPLVMRFIETAGAGTVLEGLANFAGTLWSAFGVVSLILGLVLVLWVLVTALRAGDLTPQKELNG